MAQGFRSMSDTDSDVDCYQLWNWFVRVALACFLNLRQPDHARGEDIHMTADPRNTTAVFIPATTLRSNSPSKRLGMSVSVATSTPHEAATVEAPDSTEATTTSIGMWG
jgi:hypothetical protein